MTKDTEREKMVWPPPEIDTLGGQALWLLRHYPGRKDRALYEWEKSAALLVAKAEIELEKEILKGHD